MKRYTFILSLCIFLPNAFVIAQPGTLDSTFSKDGLVKTQIGFARAVALQSDGKIVVAGADADANIFEVARFTQTGTPDKMFGNEGKVTTAFNALGTIATSVVIQTDGMIIAGGYSNAGAVMARYRTGGNLDSTFGVNGKIISDFGGSNEGVFSLALQSDGKIIAAGGANGNFVIARYKLNGTHDSTFGINGFAITDIGHNNYELCRAVKIQADGRILAAGYTFDKHGVHDAVLVRYKRNGELDNSFGNDGIVLTDLGSANDYYTSVIIQPGGKINVAGSQGGSFQLNFVVAQYNKNGTLDSSFGTNGFTITDFNNSDDRCNSIALQADGKIVLSGSVGPSHSKFGLCRYETHGYLDSSFGTNGKATTDFGGDAPDESFADIIQPNGKILAVGRSGNNHLFIAIARYNSDSSNLHFAKNIVTNIKTNKTITISLSPNPVKDVLYLRGMSTNKKSISIISENGSASQHIVTENSSYTINTKQLKAGVYFVKITEGDKTTTLKFLKD